MLEVLIKKVNKNLRGRIFIGILCMIMAVFFAAVFGVFDMIKAETTGVPYLTIHDNDTDLTAKYVEYDTPYMFDYFVYYDPGLLKFGSRYYVVPVWTEESETVKLMAVEVWGTKVSQAEKLVEIFNSDEGINEENPEIFTAKGPVRKMQPEDYEYFKEVYGNDEMEVLPYVLTDGGMEEGGVGYHIFYLIFFIVGAALVFFNSKTIKKYCNIEAIKEEANDKYGIGAFEEIVDDCQYGHKTNNDIYVGEKYLIFAKDKVYILKIEDIIWIYGFEQSYNFIPVARSVIMRDKSGNKFEVDARKRDWESIFSIIGSKNRRIIVGYNREIEILYNRNRDEFMQLGERQEESYGSKI